MKFIPVTYIMKFIPVTYTGTWVQDFFFNKNKLSRVCVLF